MQPEEAASQCLRIHYYLMSDKRFWYDKALMEASKLFCVAASNLRHDLLAQAHRAISS